MKKHLDLVERLEINEGKLDKNDTFITEHTQGIAQLAVKIEECRGEAK